jgi:hypothetical protein
MWYLASWHQHPWPAELRCWNTTFAAGDAWSTKDGRRLEVHVFEVFESPSHRNLRKLIVYNRLQEPCTMYYCFTYRHVLFAYIYNCISCLSYFHALSIQTTNGGWSVCCRGDSLVDPIGRLANTCKLWFLAVFSWAPSPNKVNKCPKFSVNPKKSQWIQAVPRVAAWPRYRRWSRLNASYPFLSHVAQVQVRLAACWRHQQCYCIGSRGGA